MRSRTVLLLALCAGELLTAVAIASWLSPSNTLQLQGNICHLAAACLHAPLGSSSCHTQVLPSWQKQVRSAVIRVRVVHLWQCPNMNNQAYYSCT